MLISPPAILLPAMTQRECFNKEQAANNDSDEDLLIDFLSFV